MAAIAELQKTAPGLAAGIRSLRAQGFTDDEIREFVIARVRTLERAGVDPRVINAIIQGRARPPTLEPLEAQAPTAAAIEQTRAFLEQQEPLTPKEVTGQTAAVFRRVQRGRAPADNFVAGAIRSVGDIASEVGQSFLEFGGRTAEEFRGGAEQAVEARGITGVPQAALGVARAAFSPFTAAIEQAAEGAIGPAIRGVTPEPVREALAPIGEAVGIPTAEDVAEVGINTMLIALGRVDPRFGVPKQLRATRPGGKAFRAAERGARATEAREADVGALGQALEQETAGTRLPKIETPDGPGTVVGETVPVAGEAAEQVIIQTPADKVAKVARKGKKAVPQPETTLPAEVQPAPAPRAAPKVSPAEFRQQAQELNTAPVGTRRLIGGLMFEKLEAGVQRVPGTERAGELQRGSVQVNLGTRKVQKVRAEPAPPELQQAVTLDAVRKLGDAKGYDLVVSPRKGGGIAVKVVGPGGRNKTFDSLQEATGFLATEPASPRQPVDFKTPTVPIPRDPPDAPVIRESTFEKAVQGKKLNKADRLNIIRQRAVAKRAAKEPLEKIITDKPVTEDFEPAGVKAIELREGALIGSVEDLTTKDELNRVVSAIKQAGLGHRVIRNPNGFEAVFFKRSTGPVKQALRLHERVLNQGVTKLSAEEHTTLGRAFGIPEGEVARFVDDIGKRPRISRRPLAPSVEDIKQRLKPPPSPVEGPASEIRSVETLLAGQREILARTTQPAGQRVVQDSIDRLTARLAALRKQPPAGGAPGPAIPQGELRPANPFASAFVSRSPLIRGLGREMLRGELATQNNLVAFKAQLNRVAEMIGGGKGTAADRRFFDIKQGIVEPATRGEREALELATEITRGFADRATPGRLKTQLANYAPHLRDVDAVYDAVRVHFIDAGDDISRLDASFRDRLSPAQFQRFRRLFLKNPTFRTVPRPEKTALLKDLFDMSTVATRVENLPQFIKDRLPEEIFVPFFLPRLKNVQPIKSFFTAMETYIPRVESSIQYDPILARWKPILESLPGAGSPVTERGVMEMLLNNVVFRRPAWDQRSLQTLTDVINTKVGREMIKVSDLNVASELLRSGQLRGLLGPDSIVANTVGGMLNTWAETGTKHFLRGFARFIEARGRPNTPGVLTELLPLFGEEVTAARPLLKRFLDANRAITRFVLHPFHLSENLNRGVAFFAGLEQAISQGLSAERVMQVGFARSSQIVPDLQLSPAALQAIETVIRAQVGATAATRAPALLGRGPLSRISTLFLSFPTNQIAFMFNGVGDEFAKGLMQADKARLMRFTALWGFYMGLPVVAAKVGMDVRNLFGFDALGGLIGFPIWKGIYNGVRAVGGQSPAATERAKEEFSNFIKNSIVPQRRFLKKVGLSPVDKNISGIIQNIERGFAVDRRMRFLYNTTSWGELMRLAGINPEAAFQSREVAFTLREAAFEHRRDKRRAIDGLLEGDVAPAQKYSQRWGRAITPEDLQRTLEERRLPAAARAARGLPREAIPGLFEPGETPPGVLRPSGQRRGRGRDIGGGFR